MPVRLVDESVNEVGKFLLKVDTIQQMGCKNGGKGKSMFFLPEPGQLSPVPGYQNSKILL